MEQIFSKILGMSADAVWLVVAVIIARIMLHKAPKYFRKILWSLVGLRLAVPFTFESAFSLIPQKTVQSVTSVPQQVVATTAQQEPSLMSVLAFVWMIGAVVIALYGVFSFIRLKVRLVDAVRYQDNIYCGDKIESPFVCGFIKPKIYIPYGLDKETEICVLQHEKTHIRHGDHIFKYLGFVLLCIHWFNPIVWLSYLLFCKDIELACDESVIKNYNKENCKQYAQALLEIGVNKVSFSVCPLAFGEVGIKERIINTLNYKRAGKFLVSAAFFLCVVVAVCFMTKPQVQATAEEKEETFVEEVSTEPNTTDVIPESESELENDEPKTQVETTQPEVNQVIDATQPEENKPSKNNETTVQKYDDSMFENEDDGLFISSLGGLNADDQDDSRLLLPVVTNPITQDETDDESGNSPNNVVWGEYGTNSEIE